jgi:hypothetical protein
MPNSVIIDRKARPACCTGYRPGDENNIRPDQALIRE